MKVPRVLALLACGLLAAVVIAPEVPSSSPIVAHSFLHLAPAASTTGGAGLTPDDIASAYGLSGGQVGTVAIVTAYSNPHLEADLTVYRSTFDLPPCTTANGCLRIVGQSGGSALPAADVGWGEETSLDVDAVSAACPDCRILVVEASSASISSLGTAVNTAVRLGANAVSASWGDDEWPSWGAASAAYFTHPGVPIVAATGDDGYAAAVFPAALPGVIAVGGTTLTSTTSGVTPSVVQEVHGGQVTTAVTSSTIAQDKRVLAAAKKASTAAKHKVAVAKARLIRARVKRDHARTRHDIAHWRHRVTSLTRALNSARRTARLAARRVSTAESTLLKDLLREQSERAAAQAKLGQTDRSGWIETAWRGAGSGCSAYVPRPAWQPGTTCSRRAIADVAADADPQTGIATFDTYGTSGDTPTGWMVAGGTSLAAPLVAGMLVRSGAASDYSDASPLYSRPGAFWDVTGGSNGSCGTALCSAGVGYDGPTGVGSPRSLDSFVPAG